MLHIKRDLITSKRDVVHSTKRDIKEHRFTHQVCCSEYSEEDAQYHFDAEAGGSLYVKRTELRHSDCAPSEYEGCVFVPLRMDINLLHACRQIYKEARFMPYSANTFSFNTARNLRAFMHFLNQRGVDVNQAFRSLHVDLSHNNHDLHAWAQAFNAVSQHMTLLDRVYINVDQRPNFFQSEQDEQKKSAMRPVLDCLANLGKTSAKSIMIVMSTQFISRFADGISVRVPSVWIGRLWSVEEKRLWVAEVKSAIEDMQLFGWREGVDSEKSG